MKKYILITIILLALFIVGCSKKEQQLEEETKTPLKIKAEGLCGTPDISDVYVCGDYIMVAGLAPGAGITYYDIDSLEINCPVISPDSMSEECKKILFESECDEKKIC